MFPDELTKFHTIAAKSSIPWDSLASAAGASFEKEAAVDAFRDFVVCRASI